MIKVQREDFDVTKEMTALDNGDLQIGAIVSFIGLVRDFTHGKEPANATMTLEHYPGMTENQLSAIEAEAHSRWALKGISIIHRIGDLAPGDNIVLVIVASRHRQNAFEAANFIMDILKVQATFWKKETVNGIGHWLDARSSDEGAAQRWHKE